MIAKTTSLCNFNVILSSLESSRLESNLYSSVLYRLLGIILNCSTNIYRNSICILLECSTLRMQ
nr:MAG TPA: hypothetical protein [Caudoviricetes sp.]